MARASSVERKLRNSVDCRVCNMDVLTLRSKLPLHAPRGWSVLLRSETLGRYGATQTKNLTPTGIPGCREAASGKTK